MGSSPEPPAGLHSVNAARIVLGAAVACEILIGFLNSASAISFWGAVLLHGCVVVLAGAGLARKDTLCSLSERSMLVFSLVLLAVAGPAGALALILVLPFAVRPNSGPEMLQSWYQRLAGAGGVEASTQLHAQVMVGRAMRFDAGPPHDFEDVIANGSLAECQAVLGLIARKFHPDYARALHLALRSEEPAVRVQAAAVVARVRADLKLQVKALLDRASKDERDVTFTDAAALNELADCPLVDRADGSLCRNAAGHILQVKLSSGLRPATAGTLSNDAKDVLTIERFLMSRTRFKEFRVARRLSKLSRREHYKVRTVRAEPEPGRGSQSAHK